jgi:hypothetical protein
MIASENIVFSDVRIMCCDIRFCVNHQFLS